MNKDNVYFIIPAYNEERAIGNVIQELLNKNFSKIIVINDGSKDNTSNIVRKYPIFMIDHIINRGQGAALGTGLNYAISQDDCQFIVTYDADGQHRIEDVEQMLEVIGDNDIVLGSRFLKLKSEGIPFRRKIMLKMATRFLWLIYGLRLTDAHNGLRVIRKESAHKMIPLFDGMLHASEMNYLIKKNKLKYIECPVTIKYTEYSLSKGQKTSNFMNLGFMTIYHKIILLFFEKE
jgi:polyprenyl-phospho-N-acetylgalactosaminyl synthase